jgi:flagellar basal body rod protein FlgG
MEISSAASLSGIQTIIKRQEATAQNIANVNTPGFESYNVNQAEMPPGGVRVASVNRTLNAEPDNSNTDLGLEMTKMLQNKNELSANVKVLRAQNEMTGALLDIIA